DVGTVYLCDCKRNVMYCTNQRYSAIHQIRTITLYTYFLIINGTTSLYEFCKWTKSDKYSTGRTKRGMQKLQRGNRSVRPRDWRKNLQRLWSCSFSRKGER